jgi:hypothetical protein
MICFVMYFPMAPVAPTMRILEGITILGTRDIFVEVGGNERQE